MEGSRNPLIRAITEKTMANIKERIELDTHAYNIIYEEVRKIAKVILDSRSRG